MAIRFRAEAELSLLGESPATKPREESVPGVNQSKARCSRGGAPVAPRPGVQSVRRGPVPGSSSADRYTQRRSSHDPPAFPPPGSARLCLETLEDRCTPTAGLLDPTFGTGGLVTTAVSANGSQANSLAIQPDGKIVAAGYGAK